MRIAAFPRDNSRDIAERVFHQWEGYLNRLDYANDTPMILTLRCTSTSKRARARAWKKIAKIWRNRRAERHVHAAGRVCDYSTARLPDTTGFAACKQLDGDTRCARRDDDGARMDRQVLGNESRDAPILPEFRVEEGRSPRAESREWNVLGSALMIV